MSPSVVEAFAGAFVELVADRVAAKLAPTITTGIAAAFEQRAQGKVLDSPTLAEKLNKSPDAFRVWLTRGGKELAAKSVNLGGGRRGFRVEDVDAFLSAKPLRRSRSVPKKGGAV